MKTVIIIHGTGGHPEENWFPWLKQKLTKFGYQVIIPQFPSLEPKTPKEWFKVFNKYRKKINKNTILIGHSLGGTFLLRVLEKLSSKIHTAIFVATPIGMKPVKFYETDKPFIQKPFNWGKIKKNAKNFLIFHSENDPYVSIRNGKKIAEELDIKLILLKNAGHFNTKSGYTKFELLFKKLKKLLSKD